MIVKPRIRGFICTTAHPTGCAANVEAQIATVEANGPLSGTKRALVLGCSGGFGLASRIVAGFGCGASTIGVSFEKAPTPKRTATAGWYNNRAFEAAATERGRLALTFDRDAFADETRTEVIAAIKEHFGKIDLLVYSLAAPVRTHPDTGETYRSSIKPLGANFVVKDLDVNKGEVRMVDLPPATEAETEATVHVMGGDDWQRWICALRDADALDDGFKTIAFSYLGSGLTARIYREGTLGRAKADVDQAAKRISYVLRDLGGNAMVGVLKAIVSQASTAIPVVPLYMSILFPVMREHGVDESCIEHVHRLFRDGIYGDHIAKDDEGRLRADARELTDEVQAEVNRRWQQAETSNLAELADVEGFRREFLGLFGFGRSDVDYDADIDPVTGASSLGAPPA